MGYTSICCRVLIRNNYDTEGKRAIDILFNYFIHSKDAYNECY